MFTVLPRNFEWMLVSFQSKSESVLVATWMLLLKTDTRLHYSSKQRQDTWVQAFWYTLKVTVKY